MRRPIHGVLAAAALAVAAGCAPAQATKQKQVFHPCPLKHGKWKPLTALTDEFEGSELDSAKWHPRNPQWKGRKPGFFHPKNVTVSDGKLHITMRRENLPDLPEGYHTYTCGAVKSKVKVRYGYFEIKAKPMNSRGSSAFWFYDSTPEVWTEIDVFEIGAGHPKHRRAVHMNVHVFHTLTNPSRHWAKSSRWDAPTDLTDSYRVYGLEWGRETIRFTIDGNVVREIPNTHWHQPLTLNFDSETMPKWFGLPDPGTLPSTFSIEYVRAWQRVDGPPDDTWRSCTFLFPGEKAKAAKGKRVVYRVKTDGPGRLLVRAQFNAEGSASRVKLAYEDDAFYAGQKAQKVQKTVSVKDRRGREVAFAFTWSKHKDEKRNNAYRHESVEIRPSRKPAIGSREVYELVAEDGELIQMKLDY